MNIDESSRKARWRLVMGPGSEEVLGGLSEDKWVQREKLLGFLYDREYGRGRRNVRTADRGAGLDESSLSVPDWLNGIHELFPREAIEQMEKDALERYELKEMVCDPQVLARAQPSETLLKAVLRTKHLMNQEVLAIARQLVRRVVEDLLRHMSQEVAAPFYGARNKRLRSQVKIAKNFDSRATIRANLKHFDRLSGKLFIETPVFHSRIRRDSRKWKIMILVDQSGSMIDSVIHSAVMGSIFFGMSQLTTRLIAFDTNVVDLTENCGDPVETLMKVQLGGGTDIGKAVSYAAQLVDNPKRTIIVVISDFFEGGPPGMLLNAVRSLTESGVTMLGLAALDQRADPVYDRDFAAKLVRLGMQVAAMTPGELANWVAQKVR